MPAASVLLLLTDVNVLRFVGSWQPLGLWWFFVVFDLWRLIGVQFSLAGVSVLASVVPFGF